MNSREEECAEKLLAEGWLSNDQAYELRSKLEAWEELWKTIKEMEPGIGDANKPLAIAASYVLLLQEGLGTKSQCALAKAENLSLNQAVFGGKCKYIRGCSYLLNGDCAREKRCLGGWLFPDEHMDELTPRQANDGTDT